MRKPTASLVIAAIAIPVFGGLATYAAATVNTKPAPQVVIPSPTADDHGGKRVHVTTPTTVDDHGGQRSAGSDDPTTPTTATTGTTPTTVDDHGGSGSGRHGSDG